MDHEQYHDHDYAYDKLASHQIYHEDEHINKLIHIHERGHQLRYHHHHHVKEHMDKHIHVHERDHEHHHHDHHHHGDHDKREQKSYVVQSVRIRLFGFGKLY